MTVSSTTPIPVPSPHRRASVDGLKRHVYEQTSALPDELVMESLLTAMALDSDSTQEGREIRIDQIQQASNSFQVPGQGQQGVPEKTLRRFHKGVACSSDRRPTTNGTCLGGTQKKR